MKRSGYNAYRWRVSKRIYIIKLFNDINGKLISDSKQIQLIKRGSVLNIQTINIINYEFNLNSGWLAGFIFADSYFSIRNHYTLTISIVQKTSGILYSIKEKLNCGHVYYDKSGDTYNLSVTNLKGIKKYYFI